LYHGAEKLPAVHYWNKLFSKMKQHKICNHKTRSPTWDKWLAKKQQL